MTIETVITPYNSGPHPLDTDDERTEATIECYVRDFHRAGTWGSYGVTVRLDIIFDTWRMLSDEAYRTFSKKLNMGLRPNEFAALWDLSQRRAKARAQLFRFSSSAELHVLMQPEREFDRFLAIGNDQDSLSATGLTRSIARDHLHENYNPQPETPQPV